MSDKIFYSTAPEDFFYSSINIPCQEACPAHTDIPAYIRSLYEGEYTDSYSINRGANILPGVLGRICSRPCEDKCRHGESELGHPVNICHIKRAAYDFRKGDLKGSGDRKLLGKSVGVIGSGPSGLAAAHDLVSLGFSVTIYEAFDKPGGMLRYGIPEFRLPRNILDEEIGYILDMGILLKTGKRVGVDLGFEEVIANHDAVLFAAGCYESNLLRIPGEDLPGVYSGLEFMMQVCKGNPPVVGKKVLVLGAGFTAFDCARSALRLGAEEVDICLRRTEQDLTVTSDEIVETKKENVNIRSLMISSRIIGQGKVDSIEFVRSSPGAVRPDGKREVSPIEGSEFIIPADTVINATGQRPAAVSIGENDPEKIKIKDGSSHTSHTSIDKFYVAGDYGTGPSTVIASIASGRNAAREIALDLTGKQFLEKVVRMQDARITDRKRTWDFIPRQEIPVLSAEARISGMDVEVETGFLKDQALEESKRCYLCYLHYEIDISRCIYCRYCIDNAPRDCIKLTNSIELNKTGAISDIKETSKWKDVNAIVIDNSRCIRCGECVRVCPVDCIYVTRVEQVERRLKHDS